MAYKELIGSFDEVRDYIREFFIYGIKKRSDFSDKSGRTYDNRRRQIESWLDGYMSFQQSASGKAQIILSTAERWFTTRFIRRLKQRTFPIMISCCIFAFLICWQEEKNWHSETLPVNCRNMDSPERRM
mgnify:CR=1 FL=1